MSFHRIFVLSFLLFCILSTAVIFFSNRIAFLLYGYDQRLLMLQTTEAFEAFHRTIFFRMIFFRCGLGMAAIQLGLSVYTVRSKKIPNRSVVRISLFASILVTLLMLAYFIQGSILGSATV
jgi:hypothetical protein